MHEPAKEAENRKRGYEDSDVSLGRVVAFAGGVAGLAIFGVVVSALVFHCFVRHQSLGPPAWPFEDSRPLPPAPRLQTVAPQDLKHYRADQDGILSSYGWIDQDTNIVRIPIDRAMDILLKNGYPVRPGSPIEGGKTKTPQPADHPAALASPEREGKK